MPRSIAFHLRASLATRRLQILIALTLLLACAANMATQWLITRGSSLSPSGAMWFLIDDQWLIELREYPSLRTASWQPDNGSVARMISLDPNYENIGRRCTSSNLPPELSDFSISDPLHLAANSWGNELVVGWPLPQLRSGIAYLEQGSRAMGDCYDCIRLPFSWQAESTSFDSYGLPLGIIQVGYLNLLIWLIIPTLIVIAAYVATRMRNAAASRCLHCGYSLTNTPSPICPECGQQNALPQS